jgi:hypothetical protein
MPRQTRPVFWWLASLVVLLLALYCYAGFAMNASLAASASARPANTRDAPRFLIASTILAVGSISCAVAAIRAMRRSKAE